MEHSIEQGPSYSLVEFTLRRGEEVRSEAGALAWMDPEVRMRTGIRGGLLQGLRRRLLTRESFFQNTYSTEAEEARLALAPGAAGDIRRVDMGSIGGELFLQKGAYLASTGDVECDSKFDGLRGLFNEGFFVLRVTGTGELFFNSYGGIEEIEVDGEYVVDNGFAVAWEPALSYGMKRARKIRSFLFSDQLILRFEGRGRLWVQSRSPQAFAAWVHPFRPVKSNSN
ncbi:MAG: TIGR00266 family protein [Planctomycetota bacterium]|jgi:uncharacterized protein (TIGR00266 family)